MNSQCRAKNGNVTIIVIYGPNEVEITCEKDDYWKKLDFAIQNAKDKLIIIGGFKCKSREER